MTQPNAAVALKVIESERPAPSARSEADTTSSNLMGVCFGGEHPTLPGRARIRWIGTDGGEREAWLPQLQGVRARPGDRVLLATPGNHDEAIVAGILDGLGPTVLAPAAEAGPLLRLAEDEALRIAGPDGQPILEVRPSATGPEVRLFTNARSPHLPGQFPGQCRPDRVRGQNW